MNNTKTIQKIEEEKAIVTESDADKLKKVIRSFIFGNKLNEKLSEDQITMCEQTAMAFNLNPLKREIHFVPREIKAKNAQGFYTGTGKYEVNIVIGYENYIKRAPQDRLNGWGVTFEGTGDAMKAILTIYRKDWEKPFIHEVYLVEARQKSPTWDKMPRFMLRKTVISQGFRLCFPEDLGGLPYTPEELGIGVIEDGHLKEEKLSEPVQKAPVLVSEQKAKIIRDLFVLKGKDQESVLNFFKVDKIEQLSAGNAESLIQRLNKFPDAESLDGFWHWFAQYFYLTVGYQTSPGSWDTSPTASRAG